MKKTIILLALAITLFSCQKEQSKVHARIPTNTSEVVIGTWKVDAVQLWNGNDIQEIHTPQQTIEFTSEGTMIVTGEGVGGTTLTDTLNYKYEVNADKYFLRIIEPNRIYQGCLVYLRPKGNGWQLGFSRPSGTNTDILWNYHCTK